MQVGGILRNKMSELTRLYFFEKKKKKQIRQGKTLRKVDPNEALPSIKDLTPEKVDSLAAILSSALSHRRSDITGSDEEDGDDDDDDDW